MVGKTTILGLVQAFLISIVFLAVGIRYFQNLDSWQLQPDEHVYLREGEFLELAVEGEWRHPIWDTFEAFDHPSVGGYIYGLSLSLSGHWPISSYFEAIDFNEGLNLSAAGQYENFGALWQKDQWWIRAAGKPLLEIKPLFPEKYAAIMWGRYTAVGLSLVGFFLAFLWLKQFFPWLVSLLGVVLIAIHPINFQEQTLPRAMLEAPLFLFTAFAGYLIALWLRHPDRSPVHWGITIGLVCALAAGIKLTGLVLLFSLFLYWLLVLIRKLVGSQTLKEFFSFGPIVMVSFLGGFILVNPQLYPDPLSGLYRFYATRQRFSLWQQYQPVGERPLPELEGRIQAGAEHVLVGESLFFQYGWINWVLVFLFVLGIGFLGRKTGQAFWNLQTKKEEFIFWWVAISFWLILTYLPLDSARYLQPLVLPTVFLQLFGVQALMMIFQRVKLTNIKSLLHLKNKRKKR